MSQDYRVRLDAFEGPLDLLLYLIRRAEVDVVDIPVATLTDQYLEYLTELDREHVKIDIELAGEFLVMAATLMEIKSQMLIPRPQGAEGEEQRTNQNELGADPRADLVRQLLAYKRFRDLADGLEKRREEWGLRVPASAAGIDGDALQAALDASGEMHLEDLNLVDLVEAYQKVAALLNFERLGDHQVTYDDTPIELHAADILDRLRRDIGPSSAIRFNDIFAGRPRGEMVGLFLAMLELIRRQEIRLELTKALDETAEIQVSLSHSDDAFPPDVVVPISPSQDASQAQSDESLMKDQAGPQGS